MSNSFNIMHELLEIMAKVRDAREGCPWDRAQTWQTIAPFTLEETYEVIEAIEQNDAKSLMIELGDLLLQILFYCQIAKEQNLFDFNQVMEALKEKLIRRHPHVFGKKTVKNIEEQRTLWQQLKAEERTNMPEKGLLADIPSALPALARAQALQEKAAIVGFDWPVIENVLAKLDEEVEELHHSLAKKELKEAQEELGDILFVCANLARHLQADAEQIMRNANQKFTRRFSGVEQKVKASNKSWQEYNLDQLENFWQAVKKEEK